MTKLKKEILSHLMDGNGEEEEPTILELSVESRWLGRKIMKNLSTLKWYRGRSASPSARQSLASLERNRPTNRTSFVLSTKSQRILSLFHRNGKGMVYGIGLNSIQRWNWSDNNDDKTTIRERTDNHNHSRDFIPRDQQKESHFVFAG